MARRKKTGLSAILGDISPTALLLHPATLFVAFNVALAVTAIWCWDRYQDKITGPHATLLSEDRIEINSPPAWTKTNIKEAILTSTGQPKSLLDPSLISDAVATCQTIGWIEQVQHMKKTNEGLKAQLVYRQPIALVELKKETVPGWKQQPRLVPVDRQGVIMPEFLAMEGSVQPRIFIHHWDQKLQSAPQYLRHINRWTAWPDNRVKDAAAISEVLIRDWQSFGLSRIISLRQIQNADDPTIAFELWSDEGQNAAIVVWGNPPGSEIDGEAPSPQKVSALQAYVQQHGPLDKLSERIIDLRSGQAVEVGRASELGYRRNLDLVR